MKAAAAAAVFKAVEWVNGLIGTTLESGLRLRRRGVQRNRSSGSRRGELRRGAGVGSDAEARRGGVGVVGGGAGAG